jgi:hypothetical protein
MSEKHYNVSALQIIDKPDDELLCTICHDVLTVPMSCSEGHAFCQSCVTVWLEQQRTCPTCKIAISMKSLTRVRTLEKVIEKLQVHCPHGNVVAMDAESKKRKLPPSDSDDRCPWKGQYKELQDHLSLSCDYATVLCSNEGCDASGLVRRSLTEHLQQCPHRKVECEHCKMDVKCNDLKKHIAECGFVQIICDCLPRKNMWTQPVRWEL